MITPHGGTLVNRTMRQQKLADACQEAEGLPRLVVNSGIANDVRNIAHGVFSPLEGFVSSQDFAAIIQSDQLTSGVPWTIPIMLDISERDSVHEGQTVCLIEEGRTGPLAIIEVADVYCWDKQAAAEAIFGTIDTQHPGVSRLCERGDYLVGGNIRLLDNDPGPYARFNLPPAQTRDVFAQRGWQTICAFQTRNVPHRGHEELQKTVLGLVDGLLIQPVIGKKKAGDYRDELILGTYQVLIDNYYPADRVVLNILPFEMRYAGPKEAIMHAIMRKNYGCTHIIIGRDHAGVGDYYGEEDAIEIFDEPQFADLQIQPITIHGDFWYCTTCQRVASDRTCPHGPDSQISFSGTNIRQLIAKGQAPPPEVMRPEVFEVIQRSGQPFVQ